MRNFIKPLSVLLLSSTLILGCKRSIDEDVEIDIDTSIVVADAQVEVAMADIDNIADQAETFTHVTKKTYDLTEVLSCATVTADTLPGITIDTFDIAIDFGIAACVGVDGKSRKGKIFVKIFRDKLNIRQKRKIETDNYFYEGQKIELSKETNFDNVDEEGKYRWATTGSAFIHYPDGSNSSHNFNRKASFYNGIGTLLDPIDDVWKFTGAETGVRRDGNNYTSTISEPLYINYGCRYFHEGKISYKIEGLTEFVVDYGAGSGCDNKVDIIQGDARKVIELD